MSSSTGESQLLTPHAATAETHVRRACAPQQEKPQQRQALALQPEKACTQQRRTSATKNK